jgi:hypothetical protein
MNFIYIFKTIGNNKNLRSKSKNLSNFGLISQKNYNF